jgi:RNA polymerase sigma factor (sigma-70 family)
MEANAEFSAVYEREIETVLVFLTRRTLDAAVAADLAAETFALAFRDWAKLCGRADEEIRAWLFTVARRQISRYLRRARAEQRAVRRLGIQVPQISRDEITEIERRAGLSRLRAEVNAQLAGLESKQAEAVRLRVVEERPYEEIALALGVSEQTVRARVSRGLRAMRLGLERGHWTGELAR